MRQQGGQGRAHAKKPNRELLEVMGIAIQGTSQIMEGQYRMGASALKQEYKDRSGTTVQCPAGTKPVVGDVLEFGNSWRFSPSCPDAPVPI